MDRERLGWMRVGNLASVAAGVIIEVLLSMIALEGLVVLFQGWGLWLLLSLFPIGGVAYLGYSRSAVEAAWHMRYLSPIALGLAAAGVALGAWGLASPRAAGAFIVAAYLLELAVGVPLSRDFARIDGAAARLFQAGVTIYVLSLPLVLVDHRLALVPLAGNTVKIVGLALLALRAG